ncbi:MAG: ATP-binding cassette domain-containing protein [Deltaproteobacteria bacterium]|nr:ATP-binding cassette domain-containing protein [Deltaproteobacteria bacterium]
MATPLPKQEFTIGSSPACFYILPHPTVADTHLSVIPISKSEYLVRDISDGGQTVIDRQTVVMARVTRYTHIKIGNITFTLDNLAEDRELPSLNLTKESEEFQAEYHLGHQGSFLVGASPSCDIVIESPRVSWRSFKLVAAKGNWAIHSLHGRGRPLALEEGRRLVVGPYLLVMGPNDVLRVSSITNNRIDLHNIDVPNPDFDDSKTNNRIGQNATPFLLRNLSLSIKSGEFVGIMGPSGAGKSVLLRTIRGIMPIRTGRILLTGQDAYKNTQLFQHIGFIPQDDVVYPELTVEENIRYATRLRLPSDWPAAEIETTVDRLLRSLFLKDCRHRQVANVSGGQRKRVNLAAEMVLEPPFILADEVCSGLSAWDTANIIHHLRRLSDSGKIVMLTIHTPDIETLDQMDMLLVLDTGGFVAYYGPAQPDAMQYFSRRLHSPYRSPKLIFDIVEKRQEKDGNEERRTSPEEWHEIYCNSPYYRKYVESRLKEIGVEETAEEGSTQKLSPSGSETADQEEELLVNRSSSNSHIKQIYQLILRRLQVFLRDKVDVRITFYQAPAMALAFFFVFQKIIASDKIKLDPFQPLRQYFAPDVIVFLAVLAAVWFGSSKSIMEIPRSHIFYRQERLSFLCDFDFIASRFVALAVIAFGQIILFSLTFHVIFILCPNFWYGPSAGILDKLQLGLFLKFTLLLWIIALAAIATAMFVSLFAKSTSAANAILPFLLIIQILLGGSRIQPLMNMSESVYYFAQTMVSRWGFEATILLMENNIKRFGNDDKSFVEANLKYSASYAFDGGNTLGNITLAQLIKTKNAGLKTILNESLGYVMTNAGELKIPEDELAQFRNIPPPDINLDHVEINPKSKLAEGIMEQFSRRRHKKVEEVLEVVESGGRLDDSNLQIWNYMVDVFPKIRLFRIYHTRTTWLMLLIITTAMVVVALLVFKFQNRRKK